MSYDITLKKVSKSYNSDALALNNIDLDIPQNSFFALLGPNGAGKSSLIHILCGLARHFSGEIHIGPYNLKKNHLDVRSCIGLVPQEFNFSIFESVENILYYQSGFYGIATAQAHKNIEYYLKKLHLWSKRKEPANTLSGGMKRRLMIARALVHNPKILLLDEPTTGIDIDLRYQTWDFLKSLHEEGRTIILTTHYLDEAEKLCDRAAFLSKGQVIFCEKMDQLLQKSALLSMRFTYENHDFNVIEFFQKHKVDVQFRRDEQCYEIHLEKNALSVNKILSLLAQSPVSVSKLETITKKLEDYFIKKGVS